MSTVEVNRAAPDFEREDMFGKAIKLSVLTRHSRVLIVLNRGFG